MRWADCAVVAIVSIRSLRTSDFWPPSCGLRDVYLRITLSYTTFSNLSVCIAMSLVLLAIWGTASGIFLIWSSSDIRDRTHTGSISPSHMPDSDFCFWLLLIPPCLRFLFSNRHLPCHSQYICVLSLCRPHAQLAYLELQPIAIILAQHRTNISGSVC